MNELLAAAGSTTDPRPWYPFVRLRSAEFWEVKGELALNSSGDVLSIADLRRGEVHAGFRPAFDAVLLDLDRARTIETLIASEWLAPEVESNVLSHLEQSAGGG
jgi:hypothetical protein